MLHSQHFAEMRILRPMLRQIWMGMHLAILELNLIAGIGADEQATPRCQRQLSASIMLTGTRKLCNSPKIISLSDCVG